MAGSKRLLILWLAIIYVAHCSAQDNVTGAFDFSADKRVESEKLQTVIEELCKDRPNKEYFRLSTESNCRDAVRCVENDFRGGHTLAAIRCPTGLVFDLDGQTCNWAAKVLKKLSFEDFLLIHCFGPHLTKINPVKTNPMFSNILKYQVNLFVCVHLLLPIFVF